MDRGRANKRLDESPGDIDMGPLPDLVGYALRRAQLAVFQDFFATFATIDLRPAEFSALVVIHRNPGLRQGRLAEALGIQPPNFAVLMDKLVARGLAERRHTAADRRVVALHLTAAGEAYLIEAMALLHMHEARTMERLGEADRAQLMRLLHALSD